MLFHLLVWQQRGTCSLFLASYGEVWCIIRHWRDILVWRHWSAWLYVVGHCSLRVWEPCQHIMMTEWCPLHLSCSNALVVSHMVCTTNLVAMLDDSRLQSCKSHKLRGLVPPQGPVWWHFVGHYAQGGKSHFRATFWSSPVPGAVAQRCFTSQADPVQFKSGVSKRSLLFQNGGGVGTWLLLACSLASRTPLSGEWSWKTSLPQERRCCLRCHSFCQEASITGCDGFLAPQKKPRLKEDDSQKIISYCRDPSYCGSRKFLKIRLILLRDRPCLDIIKFLFQ